MAIKTAFVISLNLIATLAVKNSSLTFVIDDTYSMHNEIDAVKLGTKSIVDVILASGASHIEDLVLVTFNDPGVSFRVRTNNRNEFENQLNQIRAHDGADCPELSMTGLELGLAHSRPGTFIFLITDDGPKDNTYDRMDKIKRLCQEKEIHVVFVVTPNPICMQRYTANFLPYFEIAKSSAGQVLRLDSKFEVTQIIPYIRNSVTGDRTVITSKVVPPNLWTVIPFEIDDETQYAVASTSGNQVQLRVDNENNTPVNFEAVVWINNVKVAKINNSGKYKAHIYSNSEASVVIFGRTDFTFEPGFAVTQVKSFDDAKKQPHEGVQTYMWISANEPKNLIDINYTEILDMDERLIQNLPLKKVRDNVYVTDQFLPPKSMFKVAVTGTVRKTGKTIRRLAKVPIESLKPQYGPPKIITELGDIDAVVGDRVIRIPCVVFGNPIPTIKWFVNGTLIEKGDLYSIESGTLIIKKTSNKSDNTYTCRAENSQGSDEKKHTVHIESTVGNNDPEIKYVLKSTNTTLECPLAISKNDTVRWFKNGYLHSKGELNLFDASTTDDGNYTCRVDNDFGSENGKTIEVIVDAPPTRHQNVKSDNTIEWKGGDGVISCEVDIYKPTIKIEWFYNGLLMKGKDNMEVNFLNWGNYTCKVSNYFGSVENNFLVTSKDCLIDMTSIPPKNMPLILNATLGLPNFITNQRHIIVSQGTTLKLLCNDFKKFPDKREIQASCLKEDQYVANDKHYKFSDFFCNVEIKTHTTETEETCGWKNTKTVKIGFNTGNFVEILKTCYDTNKKVPVLTKTIIPNPKFKMYEDSEISKQTYIYGEYGTKAPNNIRTIEDPNCVYVKGSLTSVEDIRFGAAQRAILEKQDFNNVFYLSCNNKSNWKQIEESIRGYISGNRDDSGFAVWSGTSQYELKNKVLVPRYLWKVIKTIDSENSLAIVTVNSPQYSEKDRLCGEEDLCNESWISEVANWPTYCCQVSEFTKAFNISDNVFVE